jgi:hypothetical protein
VCVWAGKSNLTYKKQVGLTDNPTVRVVAVISKKLAEVVCINHGEHRF